MSKNIKVVDGVKVIFKNDEAKGMCDKEIKAYIKRFHDKHEDDKFRLHTLVINLLGDDVELEYLYDSPKFERIRRITGYLVGTMDRWNNAKSAEEKDRVKHLEV